MNDTPGRMLSSLTGGDHKQHPKLGGCVGVFFQLFDWNRRLNGKRFFSNKLLPAERPRHASTKFKDSKLPMAKLLLIADENRGGFPNVVKKSDDDSALSRDQTPEDGIEEKRKPGVVARLMGLESMPSPEPSIKSKGPPKSKGTEARPPQDLIHKKYEYTDGELEERHMESRRPSGRGRFEEYSEKQKFLLPNTKGSKKLFQNGKIEAPSDFVAGPESAHYSAQRTPRAPNAKLDNLNPILLPRPKPPLHSDSFRSILSPSKCHNKAFSPTRSPLGAKSTVRTHEAAAKTREPNKPRHPAVVTPNISRGIDAEEEKRAPGNSKRASSNAVRAFKGQTLSKSWDGPDAEQSSDRNGFVLQSGRGRQEATSPISEHSRSEYKQMNDFEKRRERTSVKSEPRKKENDHAQPQVGSTRGKMLHRIGGVREETSPASSNQFLARSKSVQDRTVRQEATEHVQNAKAKGEPRQRATSKHNSVKASSNGHKDITSQEPRQARLKSVREKEEQQSSVASSSRGKSFRPDSTGIPQKSSHALASSAPTSQSSMRLSSRSANDSTIAEGGVSGSNTLGDGRLFIGTRKDGKQGSKEKEENRKAEGIQKREEESSLMRSLLRRRAARQAAEAEAKLSSEDPKRMEACSQSLGCKEENKGNCAGGELNSSSSRQASTSRDSHASVEFSSCSGKPYSREVSMAAGESVEESESFDIAGLASLIHKLGEEGKGSDGAMGETRSTQTSRFGSEEMRRSSDLGGVEKFSGSLADELRDTASSEVLSSELCARDEPVCLSALDNTSRSYCSAETLCRQSTASGSSYYHSEALIRSGNAEFVRETEENAYIHHRSCKLPAIARSDSAACLAESIGQPSPISILESPFQDEISNSSDSVVESAQEGSQVEESDATSGFAVAANCSPTTAISKPISNEADYVTEIICATKEAQLLLPDFYHHSSLPPMDSKLFSRLEEHVTADWECWSLPDDLSFEDSAADYEIYYKQTQSWQNRKLIFDCVHEALSEKLNIVDSRGGGRTSLLHPPHQQRRSWGVHDLAASVQEQIQEWREMACSSRILDDLVEKDLCRPHGRWANLDGEVEEIGSEIERTIFRLLIEELVGELSSLKMAKIII